MHGTPNCQLPIAKSSGSQPSLLEVGRWKLGGFVLLVLYASTAAAHHSFAAEYDGKKPTTLSGTVTKVEWTNPHVHFFLDVKDPSGATTQWEFTMGAVNGLFRRGWKTSMMKAGDMVTVDSFLARDGSPLAAGPER